MSHYFKFKDLQALDGFAPQGSQWKANCPAEDDHNQHLAIAQLADAPDGNGSSTASTAAPSRRFAAR